MAIYKNREVTVVAPSPTLTTPETISVRHTNGVHESVPFGQVRYTEAEKKDLIKQYPSKFDNVPTVTDEDVKNVRTGIAPTFDESAKEAAETQVKRERQQKAASEQNQKLKDQASKDLDKKVNAPTNTVPSPTTSPASQKVQTQAKK